ncbi:Oidioi.mRNA.OKI2018_I69.PAR.g8640.t1.cds [Oikopleura dioica]|uniref:Oidioi.mRNA.OKI2018_I69.PAR.g8640.t1.cds n=1 Tax=Oikopleura dioica TaxID=34765 RepID=A0ABN7RI05_OIKDI|nr:Oidioi.mRNA.OKI2018_I69.PAR.g8640.t1.cds [Oikopleura dioica]
MISVLLFIFFSVNAVIEINNENVVNTIGVDHPFVCFTLDWWPDTKVSFGNASWIGTGLNQLDFQQPRLIQAARTLASTHDYGLLRIGGTLQDSIIYDFNSSNRHCDPYPFQPEASSRTGFTQECFSPLRRRELGEFLDKANLKLIFGLNALEGRYDDFSKPWDSKKAKLLLEEFEETKMAERLFGLELGNEIYGRYSHNVNISAKSAAKDFTKLREIMDETLKKKEVKLLGYDTALDFKWLVEFFSNLTSLSTELDAFTWHQYPLGPGADPNLAEKIMDPKFFGKFSSRLDKLKQQRSLWKNHQNVPLWMGETGGAYNSGRNEVTNRFISSFWYLDLLGLFAEKKHKAFCRQTLIGGNYGLLQMLPDKKEKVKVNPDFWAGFLFASLMKEKVLEISCANEFFKCFATQQRHSLTILLINFSDQEQKEFLSDEIYSHFCSRKSLIVSSSALDSKDVYINGKLARLPEDYDQISTLEEYFAYEKNQEEIDMPPHSYGFFVLQGHK